MEIRLINEEKRVFMSSLYNVAAQGLDNLQTVCGLKTGVSRYQTRCNGDYTTHLIGSLKREQVDHLLIVEFRNLRIPVITGDRGAKTKMLVKRIVCAHAPVK